MTWSFHWLFIGGIMLAGMSMGLYLSRRKFDWKESFPLWLHLSVYTSAFLAYMGTLVRYAELVATQSPLEFAANIIPVVAFLTAISTLMFFGIFCGINHLVAVYHRFVNE